MVAFVTQMGKEDSYAVFFSHLRYESLWGPFST